MGMLISRLLAALALCAAVHAKEPKNSDAEAKRSYEKGLVLYLQCDFHASLQAVNETLKDFPKLAAAHALRARLWNIAGDAAEMRADAQRAQQEFGSSSGRGTQDFLAMGSAALLLGETDKALSSFETALNWEAGSPEALAGRARVWRARGDMSQALDILNDVIARAPHIPLYYYNRAQTRYDLGDMGGALADLTSALRLNKSFHLAYGLLGAVLAKKGDLDRALQAYDRATVLNKEFVYPYLGRAAVYETKKQEELAFKEYAIAVESSPQDAQAPFNRAEAFWRRGRRDEALSDYRRILSIEYPDSATAAAAGERFASLGFWAEAARAYTGAMKTSTGSLSLLISRAQAYEAQKDLKAAQRDIDAVTKLFPESPAAWGASGLFAMRQGREDAAVTDFNRALKLDKKNAEILVARGSFFGRTGKPNAALDDLNAAIALSPRGSPDAYNNRGALYANAFSDMDKALRDVMTAVELKPKDPGYQFNMGVIRLKTRGFSKALEAFNAALALRGPPSRILQYRAETYSQMGGHAAAMRDIQAALEKDPKNAALFAGLGSIRLRSHDYELAEQDLNQALGIDSRHTQAMILKGYASAALGSPKHALKSFDKAADRDPKSKEARTALCQARRLQKDPRAAAADCTAALSLDAAYGPAYLQRALAYLQGGQAIKAIDDIEKANQLGARRPEGLLAEAAAYAASKQYRLAHQAYIEAMRLDPNAHSFRMGLGLARGETDDYFNAIGESASAMEADSSDPAVFLVRGDSQHNAGRYDKAIEEYTKAMEIDGTFAEAYAARGIALLEQNALDAAQQDFLKAAELDPKDAAIHVRLAALLSIKGAHKLALGEIAKAERLDPKNPETHLRAGNIHYAMRNYKKALENYEAAAALEPLNANAHNGVGLGHFALRQYPEALDCFSRAIALYPLSDRFYRNRGSTYTILGQFADATLDFKTGGLVNTDPELVNEYNNLIKESEAQTSQTTESKS